MPDESYFRNDIRDSTIENLIQAQTVEMQMLRPLKPMEVALPPVEWSDRQRELAEIKERLTEEHSLPVVITGAAGVGKTALAQKVAASLLDDYVDGQIYVDLGSERPVSALRSVLMRLGVQKEWLTESLGGLLSHYRSATRASALLVVVDGVERIEEGLLFNPSSPQSALLLLSREDAGRQHAHQVGLSGLDRDDSRQLLRDICPWVNDAEAAALVKSYGGNPELIRRLAGLLRAKQRTGAEGDRMDADDFSGFPYEELLDKTYSALSSSAAWLYQLLSVLPGHEFESSIMQVFETPDGTQDEAFDELLNAQLITRTRPGWYHIEAAVLQDAARRIGTSSLPIELLAAMRQSLRWYLRRSQLADHAIMGDRLRLGIVPEEVPDHGFRNRREALSWFHANHAALSNAIRIAVFHGWRPEAWSLAEAMWAFYTNVPYPAEAERCYRTAAAVAGSATIESRMLVFHGKVLTDLGRYDEADEVLQQALELAEETEHIALIGTATELLGRLLHKQARPAEAIPFYLQALENARLRGRHRSEGWQLLFLGQANAEIGRRKEAGDYLESSIERFIEAGDGRTVVLARFELSLLRVLERAPGAVDQADVAIGWMRRLGLATHEARSLERLGKALGGNDGQRYLEAALDIFDRFGDVEAQRLRRELLED